MLKTNLEACPEVLLAQVAVYNKLKKHVLTIWNTLNDCSRCNESALQKTKHTKKARAEMITWKQQTIFPGCSIDIAVPHLHVADGDAVVDAVPDHLVLHLLPASQGLLYQDLRADGGSVLTERAAGKREHDYKSIRRITTHITQMTHMTQITS